MFSYYLLPMVIFAAGFNLDKQKFFRYGGYIFALGITGTVCIFVLIYFGSDLFTIHPVNGEPFVIPAQNRLILASVLASTDTVAPMAFVSASDFPQLYAVIFGEGVLNDVVSILLSTSVEDATKMPPLLELCGNLLRVFACSSALGVAFGLATSLLFKH
ncbi:NHX4, partial [Symbiodinium pilosum]